MWHRALCLNQLENRILAASVVAVYLHLIAQLKIQECIFAVGTEFDQSRSGLPHTAQYIHKLQLAGPVIDTVDLHLVNSVVHCTEIFSVRCRTHTAYMGTEVSLRHASQSSVEYPVHDASQASVPVGMYHGNLTVVITCHIEIFSFLVGGQVAASHSVNVYFINKGKISVRIN